MILDTELEFYKSETVNDTTSNGGRLSSNKIISGVLQNVFPHVFKAERDAGSSKARKLFCKVSNDDDDTLYNPGYCYDGPTAGDDSTSFHPGTQRDTQGDLTGSERRYCAGLLKTTVSSGATSITITVKTAAQAAMYQNGDPIRITDKATPDSGTGTEELNEINGVPSVSGLDVTISLLNALANGYAATTTKVAAIYQPGTDLTCSVDNWVETSTSGTYDESIYPVVCDNLGTVEQTWTIEMQTPTTFKITGDTLGVIATGLSIGSDQAPINPDFSKPYFTLSATGWGGTWAATETIVFQTHPAAQPLWEHRDVPVACPSLANNKIILIQMGEAA